MQRIAQAWKSSNFTDQYLIYGKIDSNRFNWEMVPYQKCRTCIGRAVQQLQVLWRAVFGAVIVSEDNGKNQVKKYEVLLKKSSEATESSSIPSKSNDPYRPCLAANYSRGRPCYLLFPNRIFSFIFPCRLIFR
jgi:hypothetical protein